MGCCAIQHVAMCLPLQVLCYSESVRWWACAYLQFPGFTQYGNTEGKPEPVKPTHRDVKLMPRLLLPFNQNPEKKVELFPCLPSSLSFSLSVSCSVCLTGCQTTKLQYIRYKKRLLLIIRSHSSWRDLKRELKEKLEGIGLLECAREAVDL